MVFALLLSIIITVTNVEAQQSLPDLIITDIKIIQTQLTWDYYPQVMRVTISYTWKNQGDLTVDHFDFVKLVGPDGKPVQLFSAGGNYGPNKDYVIAPQGKALSNYEVETFANGSVYATITKDSLAGEYTVIVELDATKVIDESNEGNNVLEKKFKILDIVPQDGPFVLPCSMQEKGDGVSASSCHGFYQNSIARAEVGINYHSGLFPITNYKAVGYFIDKNGNQGQTITVTLDKINPGESKTLVFTNPTTGFVSQFKMQMLGGTLVTETTDTILPVVTPPQNVIAQANSTSGTNVYYPPATATDNVGVTSGPTCTPTSGSIFQIGTTTVKCTASDAAGNVGSATFTVTVTITDLVVSADKLIYNSGDVVVISGKGATGNTILIDILGFNSATIQQFKVTATESGSFQTIWAVPVEIESGTYTIKVTDGTRTAKTTVQLKTSPSLGPEVLKIDSRFKNVANAWSENRISDKEFLQELQRWINSGLIVIQNMPKTLAGSSQEIPDWVRSNAGWWSSGQISNNDFASGIIYLIKQGHLPLSVSSAACPECWEEKTETTSIKVSASPESKFYEGSDTVTIRGAIKGYDRNDKTSVTVIILDPLGTIVSIAQVELDRDTGKYEAMFRSSGPLWYLSGTYTVMAKYGSESAETTFQFTGGGALTCRENQELVNGKCIDKEPTSDNSINVDGVTINTISADLDFISLLLEVEVIGNPGILEITFDREYFDSTFEGMDEPFIVLADGDTSIFEETETTSETRTLRIELPTGTEEVEIIGSHLLDDTFDEIPIKEVPIEESEIVPEEEVPELDVDLNVFVNKPLFDLGDTVQIDVNLDGITDDEHVAIDIRDPTGSTVISRTLLVTPTMEEEMEFKIPEHFKTGTYQVTATVSISGKTFTDTASFKIESQFNQIRILSVEATNQQGNPDSFTIGEMGFVKVTLDANKNIATLITVNLFDSELTSIGIGSVKTTLSSGQTEIILSFLIPEDTAKGDSDIFVNAFSDWPSQGGVPQTNEFSAKERVK